MPNFPKPMILNSWQEIWETYGRRRKDWGGWLFRGEKSETEASMPSVKTTLERAMERFGAPPEESRKYECWLLRDFARRCHLVTTYRPSDNNKMEWLALLRHYGGPGRLSDWTYSFWVALFFALDRVELDRSKKVGFCDVWALNPKLWKKRAQGRLKEVLKKYGSNSKQECDELFNITRPGIWFMNAFRLNDRLAAQQGAFIVPLDITKSLNHNVLASVSKEGLKRHLAIYRIKVTQRLLKECLEELQRMNITRSTLYLGVEGLARHQENLIGMPHLFDGVECDLSNLRF